MQASEAARALGRRGGRARAVRLSAAERIAIASLGGKARSLSFHAARRIRENFRYAEAMEGLRGPRPVVTRMRGFDGPLPGAPRSTSQHLAAPRSTPQHPAAPRSTPQHPAAPRSTP